jgi:hypothetical protein
MLVMIMSDTDTPTRLANSLDIAHEIMGILNEKTNHEVGLILSIVTAEVVHNCRAEDRDNFMEILNRGVTNLVAARDRDKNVAEGKMEH